jgi:hypothetical protein
MQCWPLARGKASADPHPDFSRPVAAAYVQALVKRPRARNCAPPFQPPSRDSGASMGQPFAADWRPDEAILSLFPEWIVAQIEA